MSCVHLQQLVQLCEQSDLRLSSSDLIHLVCKQCGKQEVCPSLLVEEFEALETERARLPDAAAFVDRGASVE